MDSSKPTATQPSVVEHLIRMVGTGAAAPTKEVGQGVTITRTGVGVYVATWAENPGTFVNAIAQLRAATPANIKNHSLILDTYDSSTKSMAMEFFDAAAAAHDLAAAEYIDLVVRFKAVS